MPFDGAVDRVSLARPQMAPLTNAALDGATPHVSLRCAIRAQWRAPLRSSRRRIAGAIRRRASKKGPSPAHRPSACSGVKALRNTSLAKAASRQAPLAFRSLDPFRALREPDCTRRDEKRPFPLRTKNCQHNPKQPLDRKSPIQLRISLPPAERPLQTPTS